jgi:tetratricopeptide (TPR) repeat protein
MSILDRMPSNEAELKAAMEFANPMLEKAMADLKLPERAMSALELMKEGLSIGDIMGLKKEHRDALLVQAGRLLKAGEVGKARDALIGLYQIEPLDERTIYMLATTYQIEGDLSAAGRLYVTFLALDATNPEGHLRLGECFLSAKEYENAEQSFSMAKTFAKSAGDAACSAHADKMLEITRGLRKSATS